MSSQGTGTTQLVDQGIEIDPRQIRNLTFVTDQVDISGSSVDVTNREARLLGRVFGSLGNQLLQRTTTFDLLVQLRNAGIEIDPRDRNWDLDFGIDQVDTTGSIVNINPIAQFAPIEKAKLTNLSLPDLDWLETDLIPTNTPTLFRIEVCVSTGGVFKVVYKTAGNPDKVCNLKDGAHLGSGNIHIFDILVHSGDSINFRFSGSGGTIEILRVQEIDAAVQ